MDNYVYIVSCLPVLSPDFNPGAGPDVDAITESIKEQCSEKDRQTIGFLLDGLDPEKLTREFYEKALAHKDRFIREYFAFDLDVRNAKAAFLNKELGRPEEMDVVSLSEEPREVEDADTLKEILGCDDIIEREKRLDLLMWNKSEALTTFDYFDMDAILGFITRLRIASRWSRLDEKTGREMFRKLTDQVRATFKGVEFDS